MAETPEEQDALHADTEDDDDGSAVVALVPIDADASAPPSPTLLAVYDGLPGDLVNFCEAERKAIVQDTVMHLKNVRDALAPTGRFKEWCAAAGLTYSSVMSRLYRLENKRTVVHVQTDSLLAVEQAKREQLQGEHARLQSEYQTVNHELTAAHSDIKRLKSQLSREQR